MTQLPDNRINLQGPLIDFPDSVGTTGQAHDNFPAPGPARYDWMRSYLIALLAHQASFTQPVEFRLGSIWFDLNDSFFKYRAANPGPIITTEGDVWNDIADGIKLDEGLSLATWYEEVKEIIGGIDPSVSSIFSRLTNATAGEGLSTGSIVYVSSNRTVKLADHTITGTAEPVGVTTIPAPMGGATVLQHIGLAVVRAEPGLTLTAGDKLWLGTAGRATNIEPVSGIIRQVGVVFDNSAYVPTATDPSVLTLFSLAGIDTVPNPPFPAIEYTAGFGGAGQGAIVYLDGLAANEVKQARADSILTCNSVVGVSRTAVLAGDTVLADAMGHVTVFSSADLIAIGSPIYLSPTSAGKVTGIQTTTSGQVVVFLGYADTSTTLPNQYFSMTWAPRTPVVVA